MFMLHSSFSSFPLPLVPLLVSSFSFLLHLSCLLSSFFSPLLSSFILFISIILILVLILFILLPLLLLLPLFWASVTSNRIIYGLPTYTVDLFYQLYNSFLSFLLRVPLFWLMTPISLPSISLSHFPTDQPLDVWISSAIISISRSSSVSPFCWPFM